MDPNELKKMITNTGLDMVPESFRSFYQMSQVLVHQDSPPQDESDLSSKRLLRSQLSHNASKNSKKSSSSNNKPSNEQNSSAKSAYFEHELK
jgi:hypothetical protein